MTTKNIIVRKESGLHARPGSDLVYLAMKFK